MSNTNWEKMVYEKDLNSAKSARRKVVDTLKIKTDDLPQYVDDGWEKSKEYKNPKYISVTRDKSIQEQFENKIWLLFVSMGFTNMNADSELYMPYDFHDESLVHQVDVLAVDDETVIMVECRATDEMTEISFAEEIKQFSDKISGLRKEILKKYPNRKSKFIWATHNYIIKKKDLLALEKAGIAYFNDSVVEYYSDLAKHLGSCSRYQLLGSLFANQEIKNMENRIPAIQGKMGGYTYYSFSIEPEKLLKIGYVLHRNEANQNMMPTYQRIIKKARLKSVRSFINDGGYFPNSIIISIDSGGKGLVFDQSSTKVDGSISKLGILHIPKRYRTAYIIDGQHRLYGYSDSKYARTNTIPVVAFVDLDRTEQIKLFMDINENQKAVPKSLRVTLNADMLWESKDPNERRQALRSKIAQMLGEEPTSPLEEYWLNEAKTFNDETRSMVGEIENKLKTIISDCLQEYFGTSWLVKGLPKNTYTKAKKLADEKTYDLQLNNDDDAEEVDIWDFVSLADCVSIVTNGKNWSSFFEEMLVRPEETKIAGGKEAKTQWILRLSAIKNKLSKESYSVPVDEYSYVKSIYDWIMEMLTL